MVVRSWFALTLVLCGCATQNTESALQPQMVASLTPMAPEPATRITPSLSAGELLEQGLVAFRTGAFDEAMYAFEQAVATGHLNDAGRSLAYWHIFEASVHTTRQDAGLDALASFVSVADEMVSQIGVTRFAHEDNSDFVERFLVVPKLERARGIVSAAWANRVADFGRSAERAVPVQSTGEMMHFVDALDGCRSWREASRAITQTTYGQIARLTLACQSGQSRVNVYFDLPEY